MLITKNTVKEITADITAHVSRLIDGEISHTEEFTNGRGVNFEIEYNANPHTKLGSVCIKLKHVELHSPPIPFKNNGNPKNNRGIALGHFLTRIEKECVEEGLFWAMMDHITRQTDLRDVVSGTTGEVKVSTPLGIDIYCHTDYNHRVFQITKHGKQVYAFEEAIDFEAGGESEMLLPVEYLTKLIHRVLNNAFTEAEFEDFEIGA